MTDDMMIHGTTPVQAYHEPERAPERPGAASFRLHSSSFSVMTLRLTALPDARFAAQLAVKIAQAPGFFHKMPIVIDLESLPEASLGQLDLTALSALLETHGLIAVGVRATTPAVTQQALIAGLAPFPAGRNDASRGSASRNDASRNSAAPAASPSPSSFSRVITEPVRSGQQIYHDAGDVIVMAAVGSGAEIIASGHIHVYGPLRGRAIAGAMGNQEARIWCAHLDPELIAIAGIYMTSERIDPAFRYQRTQIMIVGDTLRCDRLA